MSQFLGEQGFRWFMGKVEDINDPLELGRVRVRILNVDDANMPAEDLLWAQIMMPVTSASHEGIGLSPTGIDVDSRVVGFFIDGQDMQLPMIMGTFHTIPGRNPQRHGVSALARGNNIIEKEKISVEPDSAYDAKYPKNNVLQTKGGHVIEIDDTENAERIHIYHKSGSYVEINNEGRMVIKSVHDSYDISNGVKNIYVKGNCNIQTDGKLNLASKQDMTIVSQGNMTLGAQGQMVISGAGGMDLRSGYAITTQSPGGLTVNQGSITTFGNITNGTGLTGSVVAGGVWLEFRDGILTGMGGGS